VNCRGKLKLSYKLDSGTGIFARAMVSRPRSVFEDDDLIAGTFTKQHLQLKGETPVPLWPNIHLQLAKAVLYYGTNT